MGLRQSKTTAAPEVEGAATGADTTTTPETTEIKEPLGVFLKGLKDDCDAREAVRRQQVSCLVSSTVQKIAEILDSQPTRDRIKTGLAAAPTFTVVGTRRVCEFVIPCTDVGLLGSEFRQSADLIVAALNRKYPPSFFDGIWFGFYTVDHAICPAFNVVVFFKNG